MLLPTIPKLFQSTNFHDFILCYTSRSQNAGSAEHFGDLYFMAEMQMSYYQETTIVPNKCAHWLQMIPRPCLADTSSPWPHNRLLLIMEIPVPWNLVFILCTFLPVVFSRDASRQHRQVGPGPLHGPRAAPGPYPGHVCMDWWQWRIHESQDQDVGFRPQESGR